VSDDEALQALAKMKGTKKNKHLLILTGSYALQHVDYQKFLNRPAFDLMGMNFTYMVPGAERFDYHFHGSIGYVRTFRDCSTFRYFCQQFQGTHIFMTTTKHCATGPYPIPSKAEVQTCIKNNGIKKFLVQTHGHTDKFHHGGGFGYVPPNVNTYNPAIVPYGCGGSLNAMALPMAIALGYSKIFIAGVGDQNLVHFYDVSYVQPHLRKKTVLPLRELILQRYRKLDNLAKSNNVQIIVLPQSQTEASIQSIFRCVEDI